MTSQTSDSPTGPVTATAGTGKKRSPAKRPVARALARTLKALRELGRLEAADDALVELCKSTAAAVDEMPGRAALVKEYRECLVLLAGLGTDGGDDFDALLDRLRTSVGDETSS
jgi:hypothetical protein